MIDTQKIESFKVWLQDRGCEILPNTNEYEVIRWRGREVGVIYSSGRTSNSYTSKAWDCFVKAKQWDGAPIKVGRKGSYMKEKEKLILRDGTRCFYCDGEMNEDITLEHLIAISSGGKNELSNMVLAHEKCNHDVRNKPISEKVKIAIANRVSKQIAIPQF